MAGETLESTASKSPAVAVSEMAVNGHESGHDRGHAGVAILLTVAAIVAATIEGIGLLIAFNVKYMREVLEVVKSPNVALETSAANAPGVIRPV